MHNTTYGALLLLLTYTAPVAKTAMELRQEEYEAKAAKRNQEKKEKVRSIVLIMVAVLELCISALCSA